MHWCVHFTCIPHATSQHKHIGCSVIFEVFFLTKERSFSERLVDSKRATWTQPKRLECTSAATVTGYCAVSGVN